MKKEENRFETTQHDYGKGVVFERSIRSANGEIESLDPSDEHVYEMPPPGITIKNPQDTMKERAKERDFEASLTETGTGLGTGTTGMKKKSYARVSYFSMLPQEYTGSKWKDF